jgi:hypothetical protein
MHNYESEFYTMVMIEQRLLNARSELTAAERRLGGHGELSEGIRAVVDGLDETLALTRRAKRIMFREWQEADAMPTAA